MLITEETVPRPNLHIKLVNEIAEVAHGGKCMVGCNALRFDLNGQTLFCKCVSNL